MSKETTSHDIKAIIFDLGRVLVAIDNTVLVEKLFNGFDENNPDFVYKTMKNEPMIKFNSGRTSPKQFYHQMSDMFNIPMDYTAFLAVWSSIFCTMEGMEELVMQLKNNVRIGLLSDTDPIHWNHIITTWPWIGEIKKPTLSFEVGIMKPAAQIYRRAAANVDTPPENCLYIDDLQDNVEGARAVGMIAIRFENTAQIKDVLRRFNLLQYQ